MLNFDYIVSPGTQFHILKTVFKYFMCDFSSISVYNVYDKFHDCNTWEDL
jgi:hypothetical protein